MKKLYIHIGCGKCGTTVIQTILKNLNVENFYIPKMSHWRLVDEKGWELLHSEIHNIDKNCVISCEALVYTKLVNNAEFLKTIKNKFAFFDIEIIYTVRNIESYLVSSYIQHVKTMSRDTFNIEFNNWVKTHNSGFLFNNLIENFESAFGFDKINVIVYSKYVVKDFFNLLNINLSSFNHPKNRKVNGTDLNLFQAYHLANYVSSLNEEDQIIMRKNVIENMTEIGDFPCPFQACGIVKPEISNKDYSDWLIKIEYNEIISNHILRCREDIEKFCLKYKLDLSVFVLRNLLTNNISKIKN